MGGSHNTGGALYTKWGGSRVRDDGVSCQGKLTEVTFNLKNRRISRGKPGVKSYSRWREPNVSGLTGEKD